jgi:GDP-4-dehydro-6-deoxy-D-mannose reductase
VRVLITGAGGFAGQYLIRELLSRGAAQVTGGAYQGRAPADGVLTEEERSAVRWRPLDVTSDASVRALVDEAEPERVYHLAGQASVGQSFGDPLGTWEVNATGTLRLLGALQNRGGGSRVLVVSSAEVYGAVPEEEQPIREDRPLRPVSPYGASKMAAEAAALSATAGGDVEVVVARSFNHAGPGQDRRFLLPSMAEQLRQVRRGARDPELRVGNLEACRDFLDVRDVARAYARLLEAGESGAAYNVCSGEARSLRELVEALVRLSGTGARIVVDPERFRPTDMRLLVGSATRLRALGWTPQIPLEKTLNDLLERAG